MIFVSMNSTLQSVPAALARTPHPAIGDCA
jgi:hypothetical protein